MAVVLDWLMVVVLGAVVSSAGGSDVGTEVDDCVLGGAEWFDDVIDSPVVFAGDVMGGVLSTWAV